MSSSYQSLHPQIQNPKLFHQGRLGYVKNRPCVYQFTPADDGRSSIFGQWLSRDEALKRELVSVTQGLMQRG
ncbi:MAG: hypothetical protein KME32_17390 [Mojavia pulchra JT2-VF2]|jgi:hypothetical protein|uniref:Uncharacterized protein n=1 Tax=Mojavia pulchra JT2-VF2 TaxID=287848 RepID=A0A951PZF9_9NOST|nr:hypothetical protein [Mojavia pulchra JT2-VF2]